MIIKKYWHRDIGAGRYEYCGIFLLGFVPIFIVRSDYR
jgi:hypothetical protein